MNGTVKIYSTETFLLTKITKNRSVIVKNMPGFVVSCRTSGQLPVFLLLAFKALD
jgi:hypothetical protein